MPIERRIEKMVLPSECAKMLGVGVAMISAAKNQLGIHRRKVFPSEMEKFFKDNPGFTAAQVYSKRAVVQSA